MPCTGVTKTFATIGEFAREHDVSVSTVRYYEAIGLLKPEHEGPRRVYSQKDSTKLMLVLAGKRLHLHMRDISELIEAYTNHGRQGSLLDHRTIEEQLVLLNQQKSEIEKAILALKGDRSETERSDTPES